MNLNVYTVYILISTEPAPQASVSRRRATFGGNVCPKLFTSGLKRVLGLNLPVVFELCLRLSFMVAACDEEPEEKRIRLTQRLE